MYRLLQWRILKATKSRFLSILLIICIGTAFFAGLRITPLVMNTSTTNYLKNQNSVDITYISSYGITDKEMDKIALIDGIKNVQGGYHFDALCTIKSHQNGVVVYSYNDTQTINKPYLSEGRYPIENDECLVDEIYASSHPDIQIGSTMTLKTNDVTKEYKIVGLSKDTRYIIYYDRGSNTYGDGSSAGFIHLKEEAARELSYNADLHSLLGDTKYYQEVLITIDKSHISSIFSSEYDSLLEAITLDIEETITPLILQRFDTIMEDKYKQLDAPKKEYEDGLAEYNNNLQTFETEKNNTELQLLENRLLLLEQKQSLNSAQTDFTDGASTILDELKKIDNRIKALEINMDALNNEPTPPIEEGDIEVPTQDAVISEAKVSLKELQTSLDQVTLFMETTMVLENSHLAIEKAEVELDIAQTKFQQVTKDTEKKLGEAKDTLDGAKTELDKAKASIEAIPKPFTISLDYHRNQGLASFKSDSDRIDALSKVFPVIFFLVAALVSLTTMTRMVEEQRSQNGTLRALGYTKKDIIFQYLLYAMLASCIGTVIGISFGIYVFPGIIYGLYSTLLYDIPQKMVLCFDISLFLQTGGIAILTIVVATLSACLKELNVLPASLMRAKAPKMGKRIFLERIPFIWTKLSFNQKVTFRNIFRYKRRFFMSVIGIAGCTALLITGFGIQYSVTDMADRQFEDIQIYDVSLAFKTPITEESSNSVITTLKKESSLIKEQLLANQMNIEIKQNGKTIDSHLMVPKSPHRIQQYFHLMDYQTNEEIEIQDEGVILSQKASEILGVRVNDSVRITVNDKNYDVNVINICQNYLQHYIYMSPKTYESIIGEPITYNVNYMNMTEVTSKNEETLAKTLMKDENITGVTFNSTIGNNFLTQMKSIDLVVWVLIASAGLLAFVVLYNLTNINIKERTNEVATIKVLGFYRNEVNDYIFRENKVLTIIGALVGCVFGAILHRFILQTVEMDFIMFVRSLRPISFVYAIGITYIFTIVINFAMRSLLIGIDMIASLKQVE